jgi:hypothetical protein
MNHEWAPSGITEDQRSDKDQRTSTHESQACWAQTSVLQRCLSDVAFDSLGKDLIYARLKREKPIRIAFAIEMRGQPGEDVQPTPLMVEDAREIGTHDMMSIGACL